MADFELRILEADSTFYNGRCESLVVPAWDGEYGVMAGHTNLVMAVSPGALKYRVPGEEEMRIAIVSGGILKVTGGSALVLVETSDTPEELEAMKERLLWEKEQEEALMKKSAQEYFGAQMQLIRVTDKLKHKKYN